MRDLNRRGRWWLLTTDGLLTVSATAARPWSARTPVVDADWTDANDAPFSILEDSTGRLWVGGSLSGVAVRHPAIGRWPG